MAKKKEKKEEAKEAASAPSYQPPAAAEPALQAPAPTEQQMQDLAKNLPPEVQEKLKKIKEELEKFKKEVLEKFDKYIMGIALLPPAKDPAEREKVNVLILVDDSDSKRMPKFELKDKLALIIKKIGEDINKNFVTQTIILSEVWQSCYDAKYDLLELFALAAPVHDTGMLAAIKIAEVHKKMVLKKFEKYIVSYVLAGSLTQGRATPSSDIDVFVVIDDTDVKKMTRGELKDKLRAIIIGMGVEAGEMTGIRNKINIQVYILTDFWESIKEANPIIFTFLRDGVPFYDRGIFMPWKQLLRMGKIRPSMEAIDMYMSSGEQMLKRVEFKLKDIGMEDTFYAILTPSQAALMMYGVPPPTPKETPELMHEIFVKKEKILEEKYIKILENNIKIRKDIEHGTKQTLTGKEVDQLLTDADDYLKRIKRLFTQLEKMKEEESMLHGYDHVVTAIRDALRLEGVERVKDDEMITLFESEMIHAGKIPQKFLRMLHEIVQAKKQYDAGTLNKADIEKVKKQSAHFSQFMVEYLQRIRGRELEKTRVRVKHGEKYGEVTLLGNVAFIVTDVDQEEKEVSRAPINPDGGLGTIEKTTMEEFEKHLATVSIPPKVFIKEPLFEDLKRVFGKDVEILVTA